MIITITLLLVLQYIFILFQQLMLSLMLSEDSQRSRMQLTFGNIVRSKDELGMTESSLLICIVVQSLQFIHSPSQSLRFVNLCTL